MWCFGSHWSWEQLLLNQEDHRHRNRKVWKLKPTAATATGTLILLLSTSRGEWRSLPFALCASAPQNSQQRYIWYMLMWRFKCVSFACVCMCTHVQFRFGKKTQEAASLPQQTIRLHVRVYVRTRARTFHRIKVIKRAWEVFLLSKRTKTKFCKNVCTCKCI